MNERDVPYIVFESEMVKAETRDKRKDRIIALLAMIILISNMAWLWFFNQFDFKSQTVKMDTEEGGDNSYIGNDGEINNGLNDNNDNNSDAQKETQEKGGC